MKKNKVTGWRNVFSFTFSQTAKSRSFITTTVILGMILLAVLIGVNVFSAMESNDKEVISTNVAEEETKAKKPSKKEFAHTIYVLDETGLGLPMDELQKSINKKYNKVTLESVQTSSEDMMKQMETADSDSAYLHFTFDSSGLLIEGYLPKGSEYKEHDAEKFVERVSKYLNGWKDEYLNLSKEQKEFLEAGITINVIGCENESPLDFLVENYVPMLMCLALYLCIILYGQMVGNSVATEKSSKVMELLLTSVRPLAVIIGKVLSMMTLSLLQIFGFVVLALGGNSIGTILAQRINPDYNNVIVDILQELNLMTIFSPVRLLLALFVFLLGFTFYCTLAGLMGATVNRGEDLSSAMAVYSTVSAVGFLLAYLPNILGNVGQGLQMFAAIFPLSSPFILPAKILVGEVNVGMTAGGIAVLVVVVTAFIWVVAKVYEMVILYSGNKIGLKQIKAMFQKEAQ